MYRSSSLCEGRGQNGDCEALEHGITYEPRRPTSGKLLVEQSAVHLSTLLSGPLYSWMNPGKPDASAKHPRKAHPETLVPSVCSTTAEDELDTGAEVRLEVELGFKVEVVEFVFGTEVVLEVNFSEVEVSFSEVEVVFVVDSVLEFL